MIYRNIEEALYLVGMQVHSNQTVYACHTQQVGNKFCTDADTRLVLSVLSRPSEVRYYGIDSLCRCPLGCINHQQQLHKIV